MLLTCIFSSLSLHSVCVFAVSQDVMDLPDVEVLTLIKTTESTLKLVVRRVMPMRPVSADEVREILFSYVLFCVLEIHTSVWSIYTQFGLSTFSVVMPLARPSPLLTHTHTHTHTRIHHTAHVLPYPGLYQSPFDWYHVLNRASPAVPIIGVRGTKTTLNTRPTR